MNADLYVRPEAIYSILPNAPPQQEPGQPQALDGPYWSVLVCVGFPCLGAKSLYEAWPPIGNPF